MESRFKGVQPPKKKNGSMQVKRVTTSELQTFIILSRAFFGQWIHWYGHRSHECTKDFKACNGCERGWPYKFLGYIHVVGMPDSAECFLELTQTACELIDKQVPEGENLRGQRMNIRKTKGGPKGRYIVDVLERRVDPLTLPEEKDPLETLRFLWACKNNVLKTA